MSGHRPRSMRSNERGTSATMTTCTAKNATRMLMAKKCTTRALSYPPMSVRNSGNCTDFQTASHMGWFGSFNEVGAHRLVVVVMLTGGRNVSGPIAAGVAGAIYRNLSGQRYFMADGAPAKKKSDLPDIITTMPCCGVGH